MKQATGWFLLVIGLMIIFWGLYHSYQIFTAQIEPPEIFKFAQNQTSLGENEGILDPEEMIGNIVGERLEQMMPISSISKLFDLIAWSIFAMILFFGGVQVAGIGVKLIKQE